MIDFLIEWGCMAVKVFLFCLMAIAIFIGIVFTIIGCMINIFFGFLILIVAIMVVTGLFKLFEWWDWTYC